MKIKLTKEVHEQLKEIVFCNGSRNRGACLFGTKTMKVSKSYTLPVLVKKPSSRSILTNQTINIRKMCTTNWLRKALSLCI